MKRLILLMACYVISTVSFAQSFEHPVEYNNFIVDEMNQIVSKNLDYISQSVHSDNFEQIELKRKGLLGQIKTALKNISQTKPYDNGEKLQSECIDVLEMYQNIFEIEYQEVNILKQTSEASFETMEAYFNAQDKAEKNLSKATDRFYKAQKDFIKTHNIQMEAPQGNTGLEEQFNVIAEVNSYTRALYLTYFQMTKYSAAFLESVNQNDKGGIEGKRKRLEAASDQALEKLSKMNGFKGDTELLNKTKTIAKFYKSLATGGFVDIVKVVKSKQEDLTQDDVDRFNVAIETYNNQLPKLVEEYNQAQSELMKKHVPKHNVTNKKIKRT